MENERTAVNIGVSLSTQLISASLSMMAIVGALLVFAIDKREGTIGFYILFCFGFLFFLLSVFKGGKGIDIVRKEGYNKNWNLDCSKKYFNKQALFNILGIIFCLSSYFLTNPKIDEHTLELRNLNTNIESILNNYSTSTENFDSLKSELIILTNKLELIEKELNRNKNTKTTLPNNVYKK